MNATKAVPLLKLYQILIPEQLESKSRNGLHVAIKSKCDSVVFTVAEKIDKEVVSSFSEIFGVRIVPYDSGRIFVPHRRNLCSDQLLKRQKMGQRVVFAWMVMKQWKEPCYRTSIALILMNA